MAVEGVPMRERDVNQQVAEQICTGAEWQGRTFRSGEVVALLDGKVVAVAQDLDGTVRALRALEPNALRGMVCEISPPITDIIRRFCLATDTAWLRRCVARQNL